jgi:predicted aldo/keto reductase-like oxidoreductase
VSRAEHLKIVLDTGGLLDVVEEARKAGVVKHIGITSHSMEIAKEAVKSDRFETIMFPFNFITDEAADELLPLCREHDVGFIAMKPMGGGMLDNATIAFKYLFQFPDIVPIPGIEKTYEVEEIVKLLEGHLQMTEAEQQEMQKLKKELGTRFCHRCDYCQPCTVEIPISTVMTCRSFFKRIPPERFFGGMVDGAIEKATNCTECGECEARCPYNLPIREMIAEAVKWFQEEKQKYLERAAA